MRVSANQITLLRIVLLPLPLFLFYGGPTSRMIGLFILLALGLTDYLDGLLARRYGSTPLGKLLDPIADKIFIAVAFVPLAEMGILPMWIIWPIFFREFLVTEMRRFARPDAKGLKVTELAKVKTTLQMVGVGLILLTDTFPDRYITIAFLAGLLVATVFLAVTVYFRSGGITERLKVALIFEAAGLVIALALKAHHANLVYGIIIVGITLVSGYQYAAAALPGILGRGLPAAFELLLSIACPLTALGFLPFVEDRERLWVVLVLAAEFAVQGLDMWAIMEGKRDLSRFRKFLLSPFVLMLLASAFLGLVGPIWALRIYAFLISIYLMADIWVHRQLFAKGDIF